MGKKCKVEVVLLFICFVTVNLCVYGVTKRTFISLIIFEMVGEILRKNEDSFDRLLWELKLIGIIAGNQFLNF
jgi:hypothetical protein